MTEKY